MPDTESFSYNWRQHQGRPKVAKVMGEFKEGTLHSGKGGPVVTKRSQAVAIGMSEAGLSKKKVRRK